ncbi:MAG: hypothetical protein IJ455_03290 [Agathobacter sp.]|nr:hypothetical protein [Agathobacter sp.]
MGDVSVIARRLKDGHVQHGWSGNGGYFQIVGKKLLEWYVEPEMVEYLFSLGQLNYLGVPNSEKGGFAFMETHSLTGKPHYLGLCEDDMFSKIAFIDYGYLYDVDGRWYYIIPHIICIKIPLELIENNLDDRGYEFEYRKKIQKEIFTYILNEYREENSEFKTFLEINGYDNEQILQEYKNKTDVLNEFLSKHQAIRNYFDHWIVVEANEDFTEINGFRLKKRAERHIETSEW